MASEFHVVNSRQKRDLSAISVFLRVTIWIRFGSHIPITKLPFISLASYRLTIASQVSFFPESVAICQNILHVLLKETIPIYMGF